MTTYLKVDANPQGRDYVVGDVHGHLSQLKSQLDDLHFDPRVDRLFFLGDLVDRGPDSSALIEMIDQRTHISILGNHEAMMIAGLEDPACVELHRSNGGEWFYELSSKKQQAIVEKVREWPWAIEVKAGASRIGLVHADVPDSSWNVVKRLLEGINNAWSSGASLAEPEIVAAIHPLLWRRSLATRLYQEVLELGSVKRTILEYKRAFLDRVGNLNNLSPSAIRPFKIDGIDSVYMGHSYVAIPTVVGGCNFLDTYRGVAGEKLSIMCINPPAAQ